MRLPTGTCPRSSQSCSSCPCWLSRRPCRRFSSRYASPPIRCKSASKRQPAIPRTGSAGIQLFGAGGAHPVLHEVSGLLLCLIHAFDRSALLGLEARAHLGLVAAVKRFAVVNFLLIATSEQTLLLGIGLGGFLGGGRFGRFVVRCARGLSGLLRLGSLLGRLGRLIGAPRSRCNT